MNDCEAVEISNSSPAEECANWVTHGVGALLSLAGWVYLAAIAHQRGDVWHQVSFSIFGAALLALYTASFSYHIVQSVNPKAWWRKLDHAAIFLLIAGTYTPFLLTRLRSPWGWVLLSLVWFICVVGVILQFARGVGRSGWSTFAYVATGWLVILAVKPLITHVPAGGVWLLVAGGVFYTAGVVFYRWHRLRYHHAIWHVFVLGGSACHYLSVVCFLIPGSN